SPRVAMLSYSTGESGSGADVDKVREATALVRDNRPELKVDGPLQYDAAVSASVAASKMPESEVAGHATYLSSPTSTPVTTRIRPCSNRLAPSPLVPYCRA